MGIKHIDDVRHRGAVCARFLSVKCQNCKVGSCLGGNGRWKQLAVPLAVVVVPVAPSKSAPASWVCRVNKGVVLLRTGRRPLFEVSQEGSGERERMSHWLGPDG